MNDLLVRVPISGTIKVEASELVKAIAIKAANKLGYHYLYNRLQNIQTQTLPDTLRKLGIEPFAVRGVKEYQHRMQKKAESHGAWYAFVDGPGGYIGVPVTAILAILLSVALGLRLVGLDHETPAWVLGLWPLPIAACLGLIRGHIKLNKLPGLDATWKSTELHEYGDFVPEFALSRALEILEAYNGSNRLCFEVEYLDVEERSRVTLHRTADPFLTVRARTTGETYYIDVWDEPGFEGRRIK